MANKPIRKPEEAAAVAHPDRADPAAGGLNTLRVRGGLVTLRGLLQRPLASYYLLLSCSGLLLVIGLVMVFSATSVDALGRTGNAYSPVVQQGVGAVVGLGAFWWCQRLPVRTYRAMAPVGVWLAILSMFAVDALEFMARLRSDPDGVPRPLHLGPVYAQDRWLSFGSVQLQPSELGKLALAVWAADVLARKGKDIVAWRSLVFPLLPVTVLLLGLVGLNDFGSMACLLVMVTGMLFVAGVHTRVFAVLFAGIAAGMVTLIAMPGKSYRVARLTTFLDPSAADRNGPAYQFFRGVYAIANGGWFGVGLGGGHLKWGHLPEAQNDFIFAVIAEELGVVGCFVVLALLATLTYTGLRIAARVDDTFRRLVATGIIFVIAGQAVINIGGVIGLMPITGVPLPFISKGGTSLVATLAAVGVLASFARAEPAAAQVLHSRPPGRWERLLWAPLPALPAEPRTSTRGTAGQAVTRR
ncbi:FtsW/RodA/SpoVE family cell cycle protein [Dactylosporangium sp. NPDC048998]|uniref:FtsW/RodA/SpoVE family cell cycle protein n=1 Tax=Dactylosporangium sp. NPDC048998 TaxID=3363976 RepID=UPI00371D5BDA